MDALTRRFPVTGSMVAFVLLIPGYIFIPALLPGRTLHVPELALDRLVPLQPGWALVYGSLYLFLIALPVLVVRQVEHLRRTVRAYLLVWLVAYLFFLGYPTVAPRPATVIGDSFGAWGLRLLYSADPPHNCFPSLHVAHSFVSAFTVARLHRGVGIAATAAAAAVGVSTLFTKQHYILDVIAGVFLAGVAYAAFLRGYPADQAPHLDRRAAPILAWGLIGLLTLATGCVWVVHRSGAG